MDETPHVVAHFMAVGAERRLEDYHFLRNTYETITGQEIQLNRILRLLGEDEYNLGWRMGLSPIGRSRFRSPYDFDRWSNTSVLKGSIAYERLRDLEHETFRHTREPSAPVSSRRVQEIRERRQRFSEQREYPPPSASEGGGFPPSAARLRALAEYDIAMAESENKRQRQADENRLNSSKDQDRLNGSRAEDRYNKSNDDNRFKTSKDENRFGGSNGEERGRTENDKEKYKSRLDDGAQKHSRSSHLEEETNNRSAKSAGSNEDQNEKMSADEVKNSEYARRSSTKSEQKKTTDLELISFTVRRETISSATSADDEEKTPVRLSCKWASPSSSSAIDYYTIERQVNDEEWLPIGEKIDKFANQSQLDISPSTNTDDVLDGNVPTYFRLKAHLQNGQAFMSKPTDGLWLYASPEKKIVLPDVKVLSSSSVQLTWNDNEHQNQASMITEQEVKSNRYDIEKKEDEQVEWEKVSEVPLSQRSARIDSLTDARQCQFRLTPSASEPEAATKTEKEGELELLTVHNVNEWLSSLHIVPTSPTTVKVDISEDSFKAYESYKVEYTTANQLDQWKQLSDITHDDPHLTIDTLKQGTEYKFRFTPLASATTTSASAGKGETNSSQLSLILDVKTPPARRGRFTQDESVTPVATSPQSPAKEVFDVSPMTASPLDTVRSNADDNQRKPSLPASSRSSFQNDADDNQRKPSLTASSRGSFQKDADENERKPSVTTSSRGSFQKDADDNQRKPSVAASSRGSLQKDTDENERKPSLAASSKVSFQQDVDEDERPVTVSSKPSFSKQADEDDTTDANQPDSSSQKGVDESEISPANSPRTSFRQDEDENDNETAATTALVTPSVVPQFKMQKLDSTSVLIEAVVPEEEPATFEDVFDVYSKRETTNEDWTKVGTIDKEHLSTTVEDLDEDTAYAIKIDNTTSPSPDDETSTIQEFKFVTTPVKQYDPSLFLEKIEESLESVVNGVMEAAAGHQIVEEPINKSLNEVIKEVFRDETLVPSEKFGFETLALNNDLQLYRGPKQMLLKELEVDETVDSSKHYGEIIIHNHRTAHQSVMVREENGNTRVANIDGDVIIRNVVSDVTLKNEQTHHQLSMNIVGQAFLKGVQGSLIASKFRGIIVVKNVNKP